jgi:hypothetical protein
LECFPNLVSRRALPHAEACSQGEIHSRTPLKTVGTIQTPLRKRAGAILKNLPLNSCVTGALPQTAKAGGYSGQGLQWARNNKPAFQLGPRGSAICWEGAMNGLIYLIGLIVVILAILSFFGLR